MINNRKTIGKKKRKKRKFKLKPTSWQLPWLLLYKSYLLAVEKNKRDGIITSNHTECSKKKRFQPLTASWSQRNGFVITILKSLDRGKTNLNFEVLLFIFRFILFEFWSFKVIKTETHYRIDSNSKQKKVIKKS